MAQNPERLQHCHLEKLSCLGKQEWMRITYFRLTQFSSINMYEVASLRTCKEALYDKESTE